MPRLEEVANVVLRVPSIVLLDLLYRWDVQAFAELLRPKQEEAAWRRRALWHAYYLGHVLCVVVLLLPVRSLVRLYLYGLTLLLLFVGHQTARDYMRHEMEDEFQGAVYQDPVVLRRFVTALTGQILVSMLCALLMKTKQVWLFGAPLLPLLARLCGLPLQALPVVNTFAASVTVVEVLYVAASHLLVPFHLAAAACRELAQGLEMYRLVALGMSLWSQLAVPVLFLVFWLVLFTLQIYSSLASPNSLLAQQGLLFIFLSSVAECCGTPYSLLGLTFTVSYLALAVLNLCKFYLLGYDAFQNGNVMHRGVTEGVTLLLLALQTGLLDLQILQRTFLLSIILFIVVTSTLQSMIEIADPIVLALGASQNRSPWKHFRSLSLCLFLLLFPCFMAYKIARFFHMDFWLLILVSSCMLTSLQVMGTLFVYALFMVELLQDAPLEKTDEIIYYVNAVSRVLEFLVAVCVVAYGTWESIFGEWSWMGASVIIIHSYFNVWLRAQSGWKSFLLRREAAKKINSLPRATRGQLRDHNDVCAICFQEMNVAVITDCGHFFHTGCLRKWLYVQDTCPMCHQPVKPSATEGPQPIGGEQAEPEPVPEEGPPEDAAAEAAGRTRTPGPSRATEGEEPSGQDQENPALAVPSRAAEGGEPSWQEQENPALAVPSRAAEGGEPSGQEQENPALAVPSRATEGGEPSGQEQENPALAVPSRATEGGEPSGQEQENPALAVPSRATEGGEPSWQEQENPALAVPSRATEGREPSGQEQENPALAEPSRAAEGGEPSGQEQENPALAVPSRAAEGGEPSGQEQENPALAVPSRAAEGGEPSWQEQENPALAEPIRAAEGGEPSGQEQENPALAVPSRAAEGGEPSGQEQENPALAVPSRAAEGGEPSWQEQENPALAVPSRAAEGGEPSWQEQENPALAVPSRATEGGEPSWQEQENPALAEPSRATEGGEPSWQEQENPALAVPSRAAEGGEPSGQEQENPALAVPSRAAEGGEPSGQEQENPALAVPSRAGLLPEAVRSREDTPMDPAGSRTPPPVSQGCTP